eukprot:3939228-Rhodomonas_salina.1
MMHKKSRAMQRQEQAEEIDAQAEEIMTLYGPTAYTAVDEITEDMLAVIPLLSIYGYDTTPPIVSNPTFTVNCPLNLERIQDHIQIGSNTVQQGENIIRLLEYGTTSSNARGLYCTPTTPVLCTCAHNVDDKMTTFASQVQAYHDTTHAEPPTIKHVGFKMGINQLWTSAIAAMVLDSQTRPYPNGDLEQTSNDHQ